jgi:hypothetical protein
MRKLLSVKRTGVLAVVLATSSVATHAQANGPVQVANLLDGSMTSNYQLPVARAVTAADWAQVEGLRSPFVLDTYLNSGGSGMSVNGTWISGRAGTFATPSVIPAWETATNWQGGIPDAGGIATFQTGDAPGIFDASDANAVRLNSNVTLSRINYYNPQNTYLYGGAGGAITTAAGGLTIDTTGSGTRIPPAGSPIWVGGATLQAPIVGSGSVTVIGGRAPVGFGGLSPKTFSGGLILDGGTVELGEYPAGTGFQGINGGANTTDQLGTGAITLQNGGELRTNSDLTVPNLIVINNSIGVGASNGLILSLDPTEVRGNLSSSATGRLRVAASTTTLTQSNSSFLGQYTADGTTILSESGSLASADTVIVSGRLDLNAVAFDFSGIDRLSNTGNVTLAGGALRTQGLNGGYSETVGKLNLIHGSNELRMVADTGVSATLTIDQLSSSPGATLLVNGVNLGGTPGSNTSTVIINNLPSGALVGGGSATGTTQSIIPFARGLASTTTTVDAASGAGITSLVTYAPTTGLRTLSLAAGTTDYKLGIAGATAQENVLVRADETVSSPITINALVTAGTAVGGTTGTAITGTGAVTITSGALINTATNTRISVPIEFGSAPAVLSQGSAFSGSIVTGANPATIPGGMRLSGAISGTGGLTTIGRGQIHLAGANTYTGTTTLAAGMTIWTSDVRADGTTPGPFGLSTTPIILQQSGGGVFNYLLNTGSAAVRFDRDITVKPVANAPLNGAPYIIGSVGPNTVTTFNGVINVEAGARLQIGTFINGTGVGDIINGGFSGSGSIQITATNVEINSGSPGFTGTFNLGGGFLLGHPTPFGGATSIWFDAPLLNAAEPTVTIPQPIVFNPVAANFLTAAQYAGNGASDNFGGFFSTFNIANTGDPVVNSNFVLSGTFDSNGSVPPVIVAGGGTTTFTNIRNGGIQLLSNAVRDTAAPNGVRFTLGTTIFDGALQSDDVIALGRGFLLNGLNATTSRQEQPGGTLILRNNGSLGQSNLLLLADDSTVAFQNGITIASSPLQRRILEISTNNASSDGVSDAGAIRSLSGNNVFDGTVNAFKSFRVGGEVGSSITLTGIRDLSGVVTPAALPVPATRAPGTAVITKVGDNTLILGSVRNTAVIANVSNQQETVFSAFTGLNIQQGTVKLANRASDNPLTTFDEGNTGWYKSVTIAGGTTPTAKLDVADNALVIDYDTTSPKETVRQQLLAGLAGGSWTGNGIITSVSTQTIGSVTYNFRVAYGEASSFGLSGAWRGVTLDATSLIIARGITGDANFSNAVDFADLLLLAQNYNGNTKDWAQGDFDYDGLVGFSDLLLLAQNYNVVGPTGSFAGDWALAQSLVPEPTSIALIGAAGLVMTRRRRSAR